MGEYHSAESIINARKNGLKYPTGTGPLELQLGYFPLYILMMVIGGSLLIEIVG
jgi:hypothetical protein